MEFTEFSICKNDPLIKLLTRFRLGPVGLSVFFLVLAVLFTVWNWYCYAKPIEPNPYYLTYTENISWFLSLIFIFPFVLGLTFKYYQDVPLVTVNIYNKLDKKPSRDVFFRYWSDAFVKIDHPRIVLLAIVLAISFNVAYFVKIFYTEPVDSWMMQQVNGMLSEEYNVTASGWVAVFIQTVLMYWVILFGIKGLSYIHYLHRFFTTFRQEIFANPLHEDGLSGLGDIARLATWQATILLLMGIYVSLKVIDKTYFQSMSVVNDPGNVAVLISYVLFAPLMFFMLLGAAHSVMNDAKQSFLAKFNKNSVSFLNVLPSSTEIAGKKELLELMLKELACRDLFDQKIRVWPFTLRSLQGFFGAVIGPLLPIVITMLNWLLGRGG